MLRVGLVIAVAVAPCRGEARQAVASGTEGRAIDAAVPTAVAWRPRPPPPPPLGSPADDPITQVMEGRAAQRRASATASAPEGPPRGIGMMITGGALIFPGGLAWISFGLVIRSFASVGCFTECDGSDARSDSGGGGGVGLITLGGLSIATGIGLLALGANRNSQWRSWKKQQTAAPTVSRSALGTWSAGVVLRF